MLLEFLYFILILSCLFFILYIFCKDRINFKFVYLMSFVIYFFIFIYIIFIIFFNLSLFGDEPSWYELFIFIIKYLFYTFLYFLYGCLIILCIMFIVFSIYFSICFIINIIKEILIPKFIDFFNNIVIPSTLNFFKYILTNIIPAMLRLLILFFKNIFSFKLWLALRASLFDFISFMWRESHWFFILPLLVFIYIYLNIIYKIFFYLSCWLFNFIFSIIGIFSNFVIGFLFSSIVSCITFIFLYHVILLLSFFNFILDYIFRPFFIIVNFIFVKPITLLKATSFYDRYISYIVVVILRVFGPFWQWFSSSILPLILTTNRPGFFSSLSSIVVSFLLIISLWGSLFVYARSLTELSVKIFYKFLEVIGPAGVEPLTTYFFMPVIFVMFYLSSAILILLGMLWIIILSLRIIICIKDLFISIYDFLLSLCELLVYLMSGSSNSLDHFNWSNFKNDLKSFLNFFNYNELMGDKFSNKSKFIHFFMFVILLIIICLYLYFVAGFTFIFFPFF